MLSPGSVLKVCTSSSLFLQHCGAFSSRYLTSQGGRIPTYSSSRQRRACCAEGTAVAAAPRRPGVSMGPIHRSTGVASKIESIRTALRDVHHNPADGLQVIMDFDLTMTAPGSEQCHHMFETSPVLPVELRNRLAPFFTGEIELTTREAWWDGFHDVLVDARITRAQVAAVAGGADVTFRPGTAELLHLLQERGVPLLVVSAGITDIVAETLRISGLLLDNVTIRANTMHFGEDGRLERFLESPPVHSRNKHQTAEREQAYFDSHPHRRWLLVVGDKPGDADVSIGLSPDDRCLKVGFFDHSHDHPHPDLPPLPGTAPEAADSGGGGGAIGGGDGRHLEGFEFLREEHGLMLTPMPGATDSSEGGEGPVVGGSEAGRPELSSAPQERIRGRPGSQGGGETFVVANADPARVSGDGKGRQEQEEQRDREEERLKGAAGGVDATVAAEELLRMYGERFDVVACGGHTLHLIADFVMHFVGGVARAGDAVSTGENARSTGAADEGFASPER
ncbi:unnamed protein product [Scytosiphon promiscuus]